MDEHELDGLLTCSNIIQSWRGESVVQSSHKPLVFHGKRCLKSSNSYPVTGPFLCFFVFDTGTVQLLSRVSMLVAFRCGMIVLFSTASHTFTSAFFVRCSFIVCKHNQCMLCTDEPHRGWRLAKTGSSKSQPLLCGQRQFGMRVFAPKVSTPVAGMWLQILHVSRLTHHKYQYKYQYKYRY